MSSFNRSRQGSRSLNDDATNAPLLGRGTTAVYNKPEAQRWWVLFWFAYIAALQSLLWLTYSSVPDYSRTFLNVTGDSTLNLFLNEGPMAYCVTVFFAAWLLTTPNGLRKSVLAASILCALGSLIRCIPLLWGPEKRYEEHRARLIPVHIGQTLNAAAAPFVVASVAHLSMVWFPDNERNTATAIANVASAAGRAIGFGLGPALVNRAPKLPKLLSLEIGLAILPVVAVMLHYPSTPHAPPSVAAAAARSSATEAKHKAAASLLSSLKPLFAFSFICMILAGGLNMGVYGLWSGVLTEVLPSSWSDAEKGMFGLVNTVCSVVGGLLGGVITDWKPMRRKLKTVTVVSMLLSAALFGLFAVAAQPSIANHTNRTNVSTSMVLAISTEDECFGPYCFAHSAGNDHRHTTAGDFYSNGNNNGDSAGNGAPIVVQNKFLQFFGKHGLMAVCAAAGIARGVADPLFFEMSADVAHPAPAGTAGSVLTFVYHVVLVISLSIPSRILENTALPITAAVMVVCAALVMLSTVTYKRR